MSFVPVILACMMQGETLVDPQKYCMKFIGNEMTEKECIDHHRAYMADFQKQFPSFKILRFDCMPNSNHSQMEGEVA